MKTPRSVWVLLLLGSCRAPEGFLDETVGNLKTGPRRPIADPTVRGLTVALAPDPGDPFAKDSDQLQSLTARNADLRDLLLTFFSDSDLNLVLDPGLGGQTTFDFKATSVSEAFLSILEANGLGFRHQGDFIRVSRDETRLYQLNYLTGGSTASGSTWGKIVSDLPSLGEQVKVVSNEAAGTISVTGPTNALKKVENYLEKIQEVIARQVMIEARVLEVSLNDNFASGINYSLLPNFFGSNKTGLITDTRTGTTNPILNQAGVSTSTAGGFNFGVLQADKYALFITALQNQGQVRVLSAPRVATLNNIPATIELTQQVPKITTNLTISGNQTIEQQTVDLIPAGISILVTPQITDSGEIWAAISPKVTEVGKTITTPDGKSSVPTLNTRSTNATLHVRDGQSIILGGIRSIRKAEDETGIPILMDIPLIGTLFRSTKQDKTETELVIMMTPSIMRSETLPQLVTEGLSRVERISYPFHWNPMNLNNPEDQVFGLPQADAVNLTQRSTPTEAKKAEKTISRKGLARLYLAKGIQSFAGKRGFEAHSLLEQSLLFNPLDGEAELYLGLIALNSGDRERAKRHFDDRIARNPKDPVALNNRGILELLEGQPLIAEPYLRKASELAPDNQHIHNNLGTAFAQTFDRERARAEFGSAIAIDPDHAEAHFNLAQLYDGEGFEQAAIPHYEAFLNSLPSQAKPQSAAAAARLLELREKNP